MTLTLAKPVRIGDQEWTELQLREPTVGEMEKATTGAASGYASNIAMLSLVAGIPQAAVRLMGHRDFARAIDFLSAASQPGTDESAPS